MALEDETCLLSSVDDSLRVLKAALFMTRSMKYFEVSIVCQEIGRSG